MATCFDDTCWKRSPLRGLWLSWTRWDQRGSMLNAEDRPLPLLSPDTTTPFQWTTSAGAPDIGDT
jgi:hypothetical protein